ncbi:MAG TPA: sensor histidine kinase [Acidimicrobiales bacterium]|nr:sensor histidine kinase [Acidimicrobiales bacterium]
MTATITRATASTTRGRRPRSRPLRVVFGVIYLVVGLGYLFDSLHLFALHAVDLWPLALIGIGTAVLMGRVERAKVEEDRSAQLAVAEERVRIARELHDIVAHSVSLMTIQIAAARRVQRSQPTEADEALGNAEQTGRRALSELRSMLSMLRGADDLIGRAGSHRPGAESAGATRQPLPGLGDLQALVDESREAGLDVDLRVSGVEPDAPGSVGLAVYRVIQEALTNAIRHSGGAHVQVEVTYAPGFIVLFVDDDGTGGSSPRAADGHGLMGMAERVAALGGTLDAGPRSPGPGWRVHARVPLLSGPG